MTHRPALWPLWPLLFLTVCTSQQYDVLIYGASSAGVAAAVAAASASNATSSPCRVALVEPLALPGGMLSAGGLSLQDQLNSTYTPFFVSGVAREWADRVRAHYNSSEEVLTPDAFVAQAAVDAMLAARPSITVLTGCPLLSVSRAPGASLTSVRVGCSDVPLTAQVFVDASPAGDLLVMSGVSYTSGREANTTYGESLAGVLGLGGVMGRTPSPPQYQRGTHPGQQVHCFRECPPCPCPPMALQMQGSWPLGTGPASPRMLPLECPSLRPLATTAATMLCCKRFWQQQ